MSRFGLAFTILLSTLMFVSTVVLLSVFGFEIDRDSTFERECEAAGGVYFLSKSNEEYCAKSEALFYP